MAKKLVKKAATAATKKKVVKRPEKPSAKVVSSGRAVKSSATTRVQSARTTKAAPTKAKSTRAKPVPAPLARTAKAAIPASKAQPAVSKHAANNVKIITPATKTVTKIVELVKSGRPMLLQGPIAVRPMGKKATLPVTPDKPKPKPAKRRLPASSEPAFVVVQPPTKAVATSEKAAKNKAGFNQKDLDFFRDLLLAKRRELVGDMSSMEREALRENSTDLSNLPVHMADQGTDAYEQEFTLHLVEKDRTLLRELNDALAKIQNGTYGICEGTGLPISKPRLEAQPWARHSIEHARALEKRQMMFRR